MLRGTIRYEDFEGNVNYEGNCFCGKLLLDTNDLVLYEGNTIEELIEDFKEAVECYIEEIMHRRSLR